MIYKKLKKFLEADLTHYSGGEPSNPGLPKEFISSLSRPESSEKGGMSSLDQARSLTYQGLEKKRKEINFLLEKAAEHTVREYYGEFFKQDNLIFEIKIESSENMHSFYEDNKVVKEFDFDYVKNLREEDIEEIDEIDDIEEIDDTVVDADDIEFDDDDIYESLIIENKLTKLAIHKMKLINNIVQGEALNTKTLINLPETKEKLVKVYSQFETKELAEKRVDKLVNLWNNFTDSMKSFDWDRGDSNRPNSVSPFSVLGVCAVDTGTEKDTKNIQPNKPSDIDWDDIDFNESLLLESDEPFKNIIIKSRGVDFSMLIHETIKGIYSLAYSKAFKDSDLFKKVSIATGGIADETQDYKYGPIIAGDLRDFVNEVIGNIDSNIDIEKYASIRLFTYRYLCELESEEFLKVFKGILYKGTKLRLEKKHKNGDFTISNDTEEHISYSEKKVSEIVNKIIKLTKQREDKISAKERKKAEYERKMEEYKRDLKKWEEEQRILNSNRNKPKPISNKTEQEDRSNWNKTDYDEARDLAIDSGDRERWNLLSNEMSSKKMDEKVHTIFKNFKKTLKNEIYKRYK